MGACLSTFSFLVTTVFLYSKVMVQHTESDITVMMNQLDGAISQDFRFTADDHGFFVAAALTEYESNTEVIEEARYGELVFEHYGWGYDENDIAVASSELAHHYCSDEELGFTQGPDTIIYPIFESSLEEVKIWKKKFKCVDRGDLVIWGDYNSQKAQ